MKPSFFAAWRDLGLSAALSRGGTPSESVFKAASDAETYAGLMPVFRRLAAQGHVGAQFELATIYDIGQDVRPDQKRAVRLYTLAGDAGHSDAQFNLAMSYLAGEGVQPDQDQAVVWFERAAEQNNPKALNMLGVIYRDDDSDGAGQGKAEACFRRASALGDPAADLNLAVCLLSQEQATAEAEQLLERAASAGIEGAADELIDLRLKRGDENAVAKALEALQEDAEKNRFGAMARLGLALADGDRVPRDLVQSFAWMCGALAVHVENPDHRKSDLINKLDDIKQEMTAEDIDAGRELVLKRHGVNAAPILAHIYKARLFDAPDFEESDAWLTKAMEHGLETRRYIGRGIFTDVGD